MQQHTWANMADVTLMAQREREIDLLKKPCAYDLDSSHSKLKTYLAI